MTFVRGIDVSKWQPNVDWAAVRNDGVAIAVPKASQASFKDNLFAKHWAGAKSVGLVRGAYHFFTADSPGMVQLDAYSKALGDDPGDLPPILDIEGKTNNPAKLAEEAYVWLTEAEKRFGKRPLIYTAAWYWNNTYPNPPVWTGSYGLWVASYPVAAGAPSLDDLGANKFKARVPKGWTDWVFWQYSEKGRVQGVANDGKLANVDMNIYRGNLDELSQALGLDRGKLEGLPTHEPQVSFAALEEVEPSYGDSSESADTMSERARQAMEEGSGG